MGWTETDPEVVDFIDAEFLEQRDDVDTALLEDAIRDARDANRSWSEIGAMLGVSKQAAQRKYAAKLSA